MNKKKKNAIKWLLLVLVLIVTGFTVSMVACGIIKEKKAEKLQEASADGEEETVPEDLGLIQNADDGALSGKAYDENTIDFALQDLPDTLEPGGICVVDDTLYISDSYSKCIWKVTGEGVELLAGADSSRDIYDMPQGGYEDGNATEAFFRSPFGVAPFLSGVAVSDTDNGVLRLISDGEVSTIGSGEQGVSFSYPTGLAADSYGNLYVADTHANAVMMITSDGDVTTLTDKLDCPMGLCCSSDYLYIAETGSNRIVRMDISGAPYGTISGETEIVAGSSEEGFVDADALSAAFSSPKGVAVGSDGTVYVADTVNGAVRYIRNGQVSTMEVRDLSIPDAEPVSPVGLCIQGSRLYIADSFSRKIFVVDL